ncbi:single-stranded DNA-binding protein, mitochondrial-like [Anneissia japonica]|uniref:single-stranded DNA-binding protein, mitochondrial-like n=1 Tax=Anneissia japonica TaxID=1529436 RepID=UPI0014258F97|nr:single-stranded DNA-binding protein, mitochondrial-like [Anneissia japonica]
MFRPLGLVQVACRWISNGSAKVEKSLNQIVLLGRLGRNPEMRGSEENSCTTFPLATSETFKDKAGEYNQKTQWHRIVIFKPWLKDTVFSYARKGSRVYVQGKLEYSQYKDDDGNNITSTSIIADDVIFLDQKTDDNL